MSNTAVEAANPLRWELDIDPWRRSTVSGLFLKVVREARARGRELSESEVLAGVVAEANVRKGYASRDLAKRWIDPEEAQETFDFWNGLLEDLGHPDPSLLAYVRIRQEWDRMTPQEQERLRRAKKTGTVVPMEDREPSTSQVDYLRALGYEGPEPGSMAEASRLIGQRKGVRR